MESLESTNLKYRIKFMLVSFGFFFEMCKHTHETRFLPHSRACRSISYDSPDKLPTIDIFWSKRFIFHFSIFVFVTLYQWTRSSKSQNTKKRKTTNHEMQISTSFNSLLRAKEKKKHERAKNLLFIHNSMQFHTFFLVAQNRRDRWLFRSLSSFCYLLYAVFFLCSARNSLHG